MTRSYWHIKNSAGPRNDDSAEIPARVDIAVIGGGIVGIAIAYYLNAQGCGQVVVLEKEFVGYGASGRNAGFLLAGLAEPYSRLVVGMGREGARSMLQATVENHNLMSEAIREVKIACDYRRAGTYHLGVSDIEARELEESVALLCQDGFDGEYFDKNEIEGKLGFGNYAGGAFIPGDGNLDPFAFVRGLSDGLKVIEGFAVEDYGKADGGVIIQGGGRNIRAEMAVLATNAYTPLLDSFFERLIFPVKGQMLATGPGTRCALGDKTYYANFGYDYFRQTPDNTIVMGGLRDKFIETEIGFGDEINPKLQGGLEDYVGSNIGASEFSVTARWTGVMGNTIDGLPLVGPLPHNNSVVTAVGCNGHGFGLGMIIARDVARALMKGETSDLLRKFSIKRFGTF